MSTLLVNISNLLSDIVKKTISIDDLIYIFRKKSIEICLKN